MSEARYKLLVVDDSEVNRDLLSRRLIKHGFDVVTADGGREALVLLDGQLFDMVLLDVMMPDMTGIEVLKALRSFRHASTLPVIMTTALSDEEHVVEALKEGANDYVTKPVQFNVLLARIWAHLRAQRSEGPVAQLKNIGPQAVLDGKYEVIEEIGSGGFGTVFRGRHVRLDNPVAIKVLRQRRRWSRAMVRRFQLEGMTASRVQHPNAVSVLDFGIAGGEVPYLVMELLKGETLAERVARLPEGKRLPLARVAELVAPICSVLETAHAAGLVHRDVKPSNIFLHQTINGEVVKVLDFGIAKFLDSDEGLTGDGSVVGTPIYTAPERHQELEYDGRADIYAVGMVLYELLTGQFPFNISSDNPVIVALQQLREKPAPIHERRTDLSENASNLIMRAIDADPERRPGLYDLRLCLEEIAKRSSPRAASPSTAEVGPLATMETLTEGVADALEPTDSYSRASGATLVDDGNASSVAGNIATVGGHKKAPKQSGRQPAEARTKTLLLVEDNELNRDMLGRRLRRRGFTVVEAIDGQQALERVAEKPDLILMDLGLPGMSGLEITRKIRSDPALASLPIIALTAHALSTDREEALSAGCDAFSTKPVDFAELLALIERMLKR